MGPATPAGDALGVGIIGASRVAPEHARAVEATAGARLVGIADPDLPRADAVAELHGCRTWADYRALLASADVDLVVLGLPNDLHAPIALEAIEAGKHVLVEKPMATTLDACDRMIAAAERNGVCLLVGHSQRFYPSTIAARDLVRGATLGRPVMARDVWTKPLGIESRPPWFLDRRRGGGMWLMNGAHMIDRCCWVLGSGVAAVRGWVGNPLHAAGADDASVAYLHLRNGVALTLFHAGYRAGAGAEQCGVEIVLTDGMLEFDSYTGRLRVSEDGAYAVRDLPAADPFTAELGSLVSAIRSGDPLAVPTAWARHVVAVLLAVEESGRTGREIPISEADYADPE